MMDMIEKPESNKLRKNWQLDEDIIFLNHGSFGACTKSTTEEQIRWMKRIESEPVRFFEREFPQLMHEVRVNLANFLHCSAEDLALITNATTGVNTILRSLKFERGDELLVPDHAYQACRNALDYVSERWNANTVVCQLPFPISDSNEIIDSILASVTPKTKLAMLDFITSPTGYLLPIKKLVKELQARGVEVLLDAAHAPGMVELNLSDIGAEYTCGNCHKWLCTPKGSAFLHVRNDKQNKIHPLAISHGRSFPLGNNTRFRHEFDWIGTHDPSPWLTIKKTMEEIPKLIGGNWSDVMQHNHNLVIRGRDIVAEALQIDPPCPNHMIGSISTLKLPDSHSDRGIPLHDPDPLHERLLDEFKIQVPVWSWPSPRGRYIRISAQLYNHIDEYRYLAEVLQSIELT